MQLGSTPSSRVTPQSGFTLVELAIVLVIVGLLIGGVLKGQELIANTRVTMALAAVKSIEAGRGLFFDTYGFVPGDLPQATLRLPNCNNDTGCIAGNGNGRIDTAPADPINGATESSNFFIHMGLADILDGVNTIQGAGNPWIVGQGIYGASISNAHFRMGYVTYDAANNIGPLGVPGELKNGHYLVITGTDPSAEITEGSPTIIPSQALRLDSKYDDGIANTGTTRPSAQAIQFPGPWAQPANTLCVSNTGQYQTQSKNPGCFGLYIRIGD